MRVEESRYQASATSPRVAHCPGAERETGPLAAAQFVGGTESTPQAGVSLVGWATVAAAGAGFWALVIAALV
jgi:hypothetical protein